MKITDIIFNISSAVLLWMAIHLSCDNRYSLKRQLFSFPIMVICYEVLDYIKINTEILAWLLAFVVELGILLGASFLLTEGEKWRNCIFIMAQFLIANLLWSVFIMFFPPLRDVFIRIVGYDEYDVGVTVIVTILYCVMGYFGCLLFRGIKKYLGFLTDRFSKIMILGFYCINVPNALYRTIMEYKNINSNSKEWLFFGTSYLFSIISFVVIVLKLYEKIVAKDNKNYIEQRKLQREYYQTLVENNIRLKQIKDEYKKNLYSVEALGVDRYKGYAEELKEKLEVVNSIPLSGILTLDATIAECYEKAKEQEIIFECSIAPLLEEYTYIDELVSAVSDVLYTAIEYSGKTKNSKWINLAVRNKNRMLAINLEFSKKSTDSIKKESYEFRYIRKLVENVSGAFLIKSKKDKVQLALLLPAME